MNPKIKTVQYSYGKENCASHQKTPHRLSKTSKDVRKPCNKAGQSN
jgi:hypothetical protein